MINPNAEFAKIVFTDNRQFRVLFDEYLKETWKIKIKRIFRRILTITGLYGFLKNFYWKMKYVIK